jgi:hypothetical protein
MMSRKRAGRRPIQPQIFDVVGDGGASVPSGATLPPVRRNYAGDARDLGALRDVDAPDKVVGLAERSVDLIVTSPPYWRKRDYGVVGQIGQEPDAVSYADQIVKAVLEWRRVLRPSGSIFLNVGDTYHKKSLQGIPAMIETRARAAGLIVRNRIIWVKSDGHPDPVKDRLAGRHEYILHFAVNGYYYDLFGYAAVYSKGKRGANPGDVWVVPRRRDLGVSAGPRQTVPAWAGSQTISFS